MEGPFFIPFLQAILFLWVVRGHNLILEQNNFRVFRAYSTWWVALCYTWNVITTATHVGAHVIHSQLDLHIWHIVTVRMRSGAGLGVMRRHDLTKIDNDNAWPCHLEKTLREQSQGLVTWDLTLETLWLHFWQLRTTILTITLWTLNKESIRNIRKYRFIGNKA